jgi:hypothetical protein
MGRMTLVGIGRPELLFCDNESNAERLWGTPGRSPFPKDGINDRLIHGAPTVNPDGVGTKGALRYRLTIGPGRTRELRLRLTDGPEDLRVDWEHVLADRSREADQFYASLAPAASPEEAAIMRQAFAGLLWGKQFYHYSVGRWLDGDPAGPVPPAERRHGRNAQWIHLDAREVISMPDPWEYPWFAAWDLAFHCAAITHVDPDFAKEQLLLMCREWYMHPNGQLPAYEWAFGDVNPPVHAWAALRVFEIDGGRDFEFLERIFQKLLLNFTWWVNRKDRAGANVFEGGFLGLDNIGPVDRSALPEGGSLEQSDGTAWMATFCLNLLEMALLLADHDPAYEDMATKFFEHFAYIASAMNDKGLWNEEDGFYYDLLHLDGQTIPLRVRSMVGLIPVFAATTLGRATLERLPHFAEHFAWFLDHKPQYADVVGHVHALGEHEGRLLSIADPQRLQRVLRVALDEDEFLSPHGLRSLSRRHRDAPFVLRAGGMEATVDYEPAESTTALFGGNSNWRGPVWFPANCLMIESLVRYHRYFGDDVTVEIPTGSGRRYSLGQAAFLLAERLIGLFTNDERGRRPAFGRATRFQEDPAWHDAILFYEYFDGEDGSGLGASHQTGWTGLVADLIIRAAEARARSTAGDTPVIAPDPPIVHNPRQ